MKDQENKVCFILYIANKFDILKHGIGDKEQFQEEKRKLKENILKIFKENGVNKHDFSANNIYLISSQASLFENEDVSPDGKRIKAELTELLLNIKIGEPLDLFNPFTKRLITYKAKFMQDKVSKYALESAAKTSPIAIIAFAYIFVHDKIVSDCKDDFLNEFRIKPAMDLISNNEDTRNSNHHIMILKGSENYERIKTFVHEINTNKILESINLIFRNDKLHFTLEKIGSLTIYSNWSVGRRFCGKFSDEVILSLSKVGGVALEFGAGIVAVAAFPIAIGIYIKFCHSAIMKIID